MLGGIDRASFFHPAACLGVSSEDGPSIDPYLKGARVTPLMAGIIEYTHAGDVGAIGVSLRRARVMRSSQRAKTT